MAEIDGKPRLLMPEEWVRWEWFSKDKILDNLFSPAKNLIKCYLENKFIVSE